jgi:hypothetical protein
MLLDLDGFEHSLQYEMTFSGSYLVDAMNERQSLENATR